MAAFRLAFACQHIATPPAFQNANFDPAGGITMPYLVTVTFLRACTGARFHPSPCLEIGACRLDSPICTPKKHMKQKMTSTIMGFSLKNARMNDH